MKALQLVVAVGFLLFVSSCLARCVEASAEVDWRGHYELARQAAAEFDFATAEKKLLAALAALEGGGGEVAPVGLVLDELGRVYRETGRREKAKETLQRSLSLKKSGLGEDAPALADTFEELAALAAQEAEPELAEAHLLEALRLRRLEAGGSARGQADTLSSLGFFYQSRGRLQEARDRLAEAVALLEGEEEISLTLFNALVGLREVSEQEGRHEEAAALQERIDEVWKEIEARPKLLQESPRNRP